MIYKKIQTTKIRYYCTNSARIHTFTFCKKTQDTHTYAYELKIPKTSSSLQHFDSASQLVRLISSGTSKKVKDLEILQSTQDCLNHQLHYSGLTSQTTHFIITPPQSHCPCNGFLLIVHFLSMNNISPPFTIYNISPHNLGNSTGRYGEGRTICIVYTAASNVSCAF